MIKILAGGARGKKTFLPEGSGYFDIKDAHTNNPIPATRRSDVPMYSARPRTIRILRKPPIILRNILLIFYSP